MLENSIFVTKREVQDWFTILLSGCLCVFVILCTNNIICHIVSIFCLCTVSVIISNFDPLNPYCSYAIVYTLYSTGYAILIALGDRSGNYSRESLLYPTVGLLVSLLIIGPKKVKGIDFHSNSTKKIAENNYELLDYVIIALSVLTTIFAMILYLRGYSGKKEMQSANDLFYRIGVYFVRYLTIFSMIRLSNRVRLSMKYRWIIIVAGVASIFFGLLTGERDAYIRFFVCVGLILFALGILKKHHFIIVIPSAIFFMGITNIFKYYFLTGVLRGTLSETSLIERFLSSDFTAAGRNLQYLIDRDWTKGYFGFKLLITEVLYPILPSSYKINPDSWFNSYVHTGGFHGYAFTMVGTGYIISGMLGVIVLFVIIGAVIRFLYNRSSNTVISLVVYIYVITLIMFAMRESLNNIVNSFVKEIILALIAIYIMDRLFYSKTTST